MGHFFVGSHKEVAAAGQRRETGWVARQYGKAMAFEVEIAYDFRTEKAVDIAGGGDLEAGPKFLRHDAASDQSAPFEDEDLETCAGEISGSHEAVMTRADDDGVVL
jgi:hypothetical protein